MKKWYLFFFGLAILQLASRAQTTVDFTNCPSANTTDCSINAPFCGGTASVIVNKNYGAPVFIDYTYLNNGTTTTSKVIRLDGDQKIDPVSHAAIPLDAGINIPYVFKPNTHYTITVLASGRKTGFITQEAQLEVRLTGPPVNQDDGCNLGVFNSLSNNGLVAINGTPTSYDPANFTGFVMVPTANYTNIIVRSKSTAQNPGQINTLLVYRITIQETGALGDPNNICYDLDYVINYNVPMDFNHINRSPPPGESVFAFAGKIMAWHTITCSANLTVQNGNYIYVANQQISFLPGYSVTLSNGGSMQAVIGKCTDLSPLEVVIPGDSMNTSPPILVPALAQRAAEDDLAANGLKIWPNPTSGLVELSARGDRLKDAELTVVDLAGHILLRYYNEGKTKALLDLSILKNGMYFLQIRNATGMTVHKFVVNK